MTDLSPDAGQHMSREIAEAPGVFSTAVAQPVTLPDLSHLRAIYTVARGSSDAAANILAYELMRETHLPVTSLPPSIFSLGHGVRLQDSAVLVVSQSGASDDLVRSARGAKAMGATVLALTNAPGSQVEAEAQTTLKIGAGPELAVPATKSVVGAIAAGMALLSALAPAYAPRAKASTQAISALKGRSLPQQKALLSALLRASHVYIIGRDTGFGAAQELALKLKECCALHAEAYSSSEVLHGPLQLVTNPLLILILDTEQPEVQDSLDTAEGRFRTAGGTVFRLRPSDVGATGLTPAAAAATLLILTYPLALETALALGHDPDRPATLSKVTQTR
jgi:glucosamine--fructose-6-phosphate aminotransferase (isomerizing)